MQSIRISIALVLSLLVSVAIAGDFVNISEKEFKTFMKSKDYVVIDLRTPGEIEKTGVVKGAQVIDFINGDFTGYISKLKKNKKYIVYCRSGGRSAKAASQMVDKGLSVVNYSAGISGWLTNKNETEKYKEK